MHSDTSIGGFAIERGGNDFMGRNSGFTLLELIVVMGIMMVTICAVPAFFLYFERQGVRLAADQLHGDLQLARIMAINRKRKCTIMLNQPGPNRYANSLNGQITDLSGFRGGVGFPVKGPDGGKTAKVVSFNRRGMSTSAVPVDVYLTDRKRSCEYRIRILAPGGISVTRWNGREWR